MIKIAIVDDSKLYIDKIKSLLSKHMYVEYEVYEYTSGSSFMTAADSTYFDIIYLDIVLGSQNGIEIGAEINQKHSGSNIVFMSADSSYFKDVYKVRHSYFLTKEFEEDRFVDSLSKLLDTTRELTITVDSNRQTHKILFREILYLESALRHSLLHLINGDIIECSTNIKNIEAVLPETTFVRTHKSFVVNMMHIKRYDRQTITLSNGSLVPISRAHSSDARQKITLYLGGKI